MVLVSACLLGVKCNFQGDCFARGTLQEGFLNEDVFPVCPEVLGGLSVPRSPAEIQGGDGGDVLNGRARVVALDGVDVTARFLDGARRTLDIARAVGAAEAYLLETSPSCGTGKILDGSFTFTYRSGDGVTAALLKREGVRVHLVEAPRETVERLEEEAARMRAGLPGVKTPPDPVRSAPRDLDTR